MGISHYVARQFNARTVGLELNAELVEQAQLSAQLAGLSDLCEFRVEDIMDMKWASEVWSGAFVYLLPEAMAELEDALMKLNCPIVTIGQFRFPKAVPCESAAGWAIYNLPKVEGSG